MGLHVGLSVHLFLTSFLGVRAVPVSRVGSQIGSCGEWQGGGGGRKYTGEELKGRCWEIHTPARNCNKVNDTAGYRSQTLKNNTLVRCLGPAHLLCWGFVGCAHAAGIGTREDGISASRYLRRARVYDPQSPTGTMAGTTGKAGPKGLGADRTGIADHLTLAFL